MSSYQGQLSDLDWDSADMCRSTTLSGPLLIGPRSALQQNTHIHQSTLGADSSIGPGTTISRSYAFDDVRIGANCTLEECIIGQSVVIGDGVVVGRGALIGDGVKLGKGVRVPDFARIGKERFRGDDYDEDEDDEEESGEEKGESAPYLMRLY
jgi:translation initiation factor eIF-2B subunit epsilon